MATQAAIFVVGQNTGGVSTLAAPFTASLANNAVSSEIAVGPRQLFVVVSSGAINIRFGPAGTVTATTADFFLPAGVMATFDSSDFWNSICILNSSGATNSYWVTKMSKA